jgi:hypothetical protein
VGFGSCRRRRRRPERIPGVFAERHGKDVQVVPHLSDALRDAVDPTDDEGLVHAIAIQVFDERGFCDRAIGQPVGECVSSGPLFYNPVDV